MILLFEYFFLFRNYLFFIKKFDTDEITDINIDADKIHGKETTLINEMRTFNPKILYPKSFQVYIC